MIAATTRILLLAMALLISGCATCPERYRGDMDARRAGDKIVVSGRPG